MKKIYFFALLACCAFTITNAQLIFEEPFAYPVGNLQGSAGGSGFPMGSMWSQTTTSAAPGAVANAQIVSGNLGTTGIGNKVRVCTETSKQSFFDRAIPATLNDDNVTDYYVGFWFSTSSTLGTGTYAVPAQLIFLNTPNTTTANDMRLGFGKSSNVGSANILTGFTRAAGETCGSATSWPSQLTNGTTAGSTYGGGVGLNTLNLPDGQGTYYILAKITKKEFTINAGTPATSQYFDGVRVWFLSAPPTGTTDAIFTTRPNGDVLTTVTSNGVPPVTPNLPNYLTDNPIQTRALRVNGTIATAPLYSSQTCATVAGGVTGIRLRVEGGNGNCFEFDELRLSIGLSGILLSNSLESIQAKNVGNTNEIKWHMLTETNNNGFEMEQSSNGSTWKKIGFIPSAGISSFRTNYSFTDNNPFAVTYYRLRQQDASGNITYSKIVKAVQDVKVAIQISPNPAQDNVVIRLNKSNNNNLISIYDLAGRIVLKTQFNGNFYEANIANFQKGLYFLHATVDGIKTIQKFVKN